MNIFPASNQRKIRILFNILEYFKAKISELVYFCTTKAAIFEHFFLNHREFNEEKVQI